MKFSAKLIVLLIFFLAIAAVNATDELGDDTILSESADYGAVDNSVVLSQSVSYDVENNLNVSSEVDESGQGEIIGSSVSDENVLGDYEHSLKKLQELIDTHNDDTLVLTQDYVYDSTYDTVYGGIIINKTGFTIDGNGHAVRGNPSHVNNVGARLFIVTAEHVTFKNMNLTDAYIPENKTEDPSTIGSNPYHDGGAILWFASYATIINCTFDYNNIYYRSGYHSWGSSIYWGAKTGFTVINSTFLNTGNYGLTNSAVVFLQGSDVHIENSTFSNWYTSDENGGAIYLYNATNHSCFSNVNLINNTFKDSWHTKNVVHLFASGDINIINNTFCNYSVYSGSVVLYGHAQNVNISNNTFDTFASSYGAGISMEDEGRDYFYVGYNTFKNYNGGYRILLLRDNSNMGTLIIEHNNFTNLTFTSTAADGGSTIYIYNGFSMAYVHDNNFSQISAARYGGAIWSKSPVSIENNIFNDINITGSKGINVIGAAIYGTNYTYVSNNNFTYCGYNDTPDSIDGIIAIGDMGCGIITNNIFSNNNITRSFYYHTGIISNKGNNSIIENNNFTDNNCSDCLGGIVYNTGDNVIIHNNTILNTIGGTGGTFYNTGMNVTFDMNNITNAYTTVDGGAVYIENGNVTVHYNNFTNVSAENNYGVIYCNGENSTIYNNNYIDNHALSQGVVALGSNIKLYNENFTNPHVTNGQAGTIMIIGDNNDITNINIYNSSALTGGAVVNRGNYNNMTNIIINSTAATLTDGGAIYSTGNNFNVNTLRVYNSNATLDGGAFYNSGSDGTLNDAIFDNINASRNGGVIFWSGDKGTLSDVTITNAHAEGDGGAIYWIGSNGHISNINLINNTYAISGAAIYCSGVACTVDTAVLRNIRATGDGGAVYWNGAEANLTGILFENITSASNGGAIFGTAVDSNLTDLTFKNVNSSSNGGAIYWAGARCSLNNLIFINTTSLLGNGGALYLSGDKSSARKIRLENITSEGNGAVYWSGSYSNFTCATFINCNAKGMGGAVYWTGSCGNLSDSTFINNTANNGGAVLWNAVKGLVYNSTFIDNYAKGNGGGIYWIGNNATLYDLDMTGNNVSSKGGAIYLKGNFAKLYDLTCINSNAYVDGGAVLVDGSDGSLTNSTFVHNIAGTNGGSIFWAGVRGTLYNVNITNGSAGVGGAVYWYADNANISMINFTNNNATIAGALYMGGLTNGTVADSTFINNNASTNGGAIYWTSSNGNLTSCTFEGATARDGGAIYWSGDIATLSNLHFSKVNATTNGGIVLVSAYGVNISDSNFSNSNASRGGAIYWSGTNGCLNNAVFSNNSAIENGGAIYWIGNNGNITDVNFTNNTAGSEGGALYIISYGAVLDNTEFYYNNASKGGGAVYWAGTGNIDEAQFKFNRAYSGSAIYNAGTLDISSTTILNNTANITSFEFHEDETNIQMSIAAVVRGMDNFLNGIQTTSSNIRVKGVTYYGADGEDTTDNTYFIRPRNGASSSGLFYDNRLAGVPINISYVNSHGVIVHGESVVTNAFGNFTYSAIKFANDNYTVTATHEGDSYYYASSGSGIVEVHPIIPDLEVSLVLPGSDRNVYYDTNVTIKALVVASDGHNVSTSIRGPVEIYVDDEYIGLTLNVTNGTVEFTTMLPDKYKVGIHNISGKFLGGFDDKDTPIDPINSSSAFFFNIIRNEMPTVINISTIKPVFYVDEMLNITIEGPKQYTGNITYVAGNYKGVCKFVDGIYVIPAVYSYNGTINVLAFVGGDENYLPSSASYSFDVIKRNVSIGFVDLVDGNLSSVNVSDNVTIGVVLDVYDAAGDIVIGIDGVNYTVTIVDGNGVVLNVSSFAEGIHNVTAFYTGNYKYDASEIINTSFTVKKITINTVNVSADNSSIFVGDNVVLTVSLITDSKYPVNGIANVTVAGKEYAVVIEDNIGHLTLSGLLNGVYNVTVCYADGQFNFINYTVDDVVTVYKINTSASIIPVVDVIYAGDDAIFNIQIDSDKYVVNGSVIVSINGTNYTVSIVDGKGSLTVSDLAYSNGGFYNVTVLYNGDYQFNGAYNETVLGVEKNDISVVTVKVANNPVYVGQDAVLNVTMKSGGKVVNGHATLVVDGEEYVVHISQGSGTVNISGLAYSLDPYPVDFYYDGDNIFNSINELDICEINIRKINIANITAKPDNQSIHVGENATLNFNISSSIHDSYPVNGFITVKVNGIEYIVSISNNTGSADISGLPYGNHNVFVSYAGDETFNSFNKYNSIPIANISVSKINTNISMNNVSISVGSAAVIVAHINNPEVTGNVTFVVDNKVYVSAIVDGVASCEVYDLKVSANNTIISAVYSGDYKFEDSATNASLFVGTVDGQISVSVYDIVAGETEKVVIVLPSDLSNGTITVKFDDETLGTRDYSVVRNVITFNRTISAEGVYDVNVSVIGDAKYGSINASDSFTVSTVSDYPIFVDVDDIVLGSNATVFVVLPSDAVEGNVTINGINYTVADARNGIVLPKEDSAGVHTVSVSYSDSKYGLKSVNIDYTVLKAGSNVSIIMNDEFYVGDDITFKVNATNSTGRITVIINDKTYHPDNNTPMTVNPNLLSNSYNVIVELEGDSNYAGSKTSKLINVIKKNVSVEVTDPGSFNVGDIIPITATFNDTVTGTVIFNVNGVNYTVGVNGNSAGFDYSPLTDGAFNVTAYYSGDYKFNANSSNIAQFTVSKIVTRLIISAGFIHVGQDAVINVEVRDNQATGNVIVSINNRNYTVCLNEGKGSVTVKGLTNNTDNNIAAVYTGDNKYNASYNTSSIAVEKLDINVVVNQITENINVGQKAILNIGVTPSIAGYKFNDILTVKINDTLYNASIVNNSGILNIYDLEYGVYSVKIVYDGNEMYNSFEKTDIPKINVDKVHVSLDITPNSQSVLIGDDIIFNISVIPALGNYTVNGFVNVDVDGRYYYNVSITENVGQLIIHDPLLDGVYPFNVNYLGDSTFYGNDANAQFVVDKVPTRIQMNNVSINAGNVAVIVARINNSAASGNVTFTVDNKKYTVGIIDGIATLEVYGLNSSANNTVIEAVYSGDYKFMGSTNTSKLFVDRLNDTVSISVYDINAGETESVVIVLPSDVTNGAISVKFDNDPVDDYVIKNNVITFNRTINVSGNYTVDVSVTGDVKYNNLAASANFTVFKTDDYNILVSADNVIVGENTTVKVNLPDDATTGIVIINGKECSVSDAKMGVNLPAQSNTGSYDVNITYVDDVKYTNKTVVTSYRVYRAGSSVSIDIVEDFYVGDDIGFTVTSVNSTGKIVVVINNKEYYPENNTLYTIYGGLANGTYDVIVKLDADANYNASKNSKIIKVHKKQVDLTLDITPITDIKVDDKVNITAEFSDNVTGNVIFEVNGVNYTTYIDGNKVKYTYVPKTNGSFEVKAYYSGDDKFNPSSSSTKSFDVSKISTVLKIYAEPVYVGQDALINVEVISNEATGNVVIKVNNKSYTVTLVKGKGSISVNGLTDDTDNEIYAIYSGDNKYSSSDCVSNVVVNKVDISNIVVSPRSQNIYVGRDAALSIKVIPGIENYLVNDYVTVHINGTSYNVSVIDNMGSLNVSNLKFGNYSVDVSYNGSVMYNSLSKTNVSTIIVNKVDITLIAVSLVNQSIYVGQNAILDITLIPFLNDYSVDGFVTVTVNNVDYNVSIKNNTGHLVVYDLPEGNYPINVYYAGDNTYNPKEVNPTFIIVNKVPVSVSVTPSNQSVYVGDNPMLTVSILPSVDDYVVNGFTIIFIEDNMYNVSVINNTGYLTVYDLANGTYSVDIDYLGDDTFKLNYTIRIASIYVNKRPNTITVDNVSINVGDVANIEALINESSVTGNVTFIVDDNVYIVGIVDGVARLNVTGLNTSANKTITALYSGDYKFTNSTTLAYLNISKVDSNASITVYNITAGETETVIITLPDDVSNGTVTVKFNDLEVTDYSIDNNVISFNRTLQVSGNYSVSVSVTDDCKYNDFNNSTVFTVFKVAPEKYAIVIHVNDTHVFESIPIVINLPIDANETLSLSVDGDLVNDSVAVANGVANYTHVNLGYGNHTITVTYGNDKYADKTVSTNVFVAKIASAVNIINPVDPRVAHEIIVNVTPIGSTGAVTVTINNKTYDVIDRSWVNASGLLEGDYTIVVVLAEDENYLESTNSSVFFVSRNNVSMSLKNITGDVLVDSSVVLHVDFTENVTGSVVFNVNGNNYTVNITESDYAEYTWVPVNEGNVTVGAIYSGNDTYYPCGCDAISFEVYRNLAEFTNLIVSDIMVGDIENITATLNVTDVTGAVIFVVNGTEYESNVLGGLAFLSIPDLPAGDYAIGVYYPGDNKYYPIEPYVTKFTVNKYPSPIDIIAEDIMVLDNATVIVTLPEEINDLINISVANDSINVVLVNGTASWTVSDLPAGNYTVSVAYSGNPKYASNTSASTFVVSKYDSIFDVNVSDVFWTGDDNNIGVVLSDDATGNVTVSINGTDYVLPVSDGSVDFTVPDLPAGDYEGVVTYSGDYKYDSVSESFNFTVVDNYPIIESSDVVKYYAGSGRLRVNLTNVRGDRLANETVYVTINGVTYARVTNENGSFSLPINLPAGKYVVDIVYNSTRYGVINSSVDVSVLSSIVSEDLVKVYHNDSQFYARFLDSSGNALADTKVTFNINGVFYTRTTDADGWAKLNINLPKGEYVITSYNPVTGESRSNLITVLPRITENYDLVKVYRNGSQFTVCIIGDDGNPVGAGENVTFNINGVFYTRSTNSTGYVKLNINLPEGEYIITTYYKDCSESNKITVLKNDEGGL